MIYNTTYTNPQTTFMINKRVGKPFPFLQRLKMGGIGSKRMNIIEFSTALKEYSTTVADTQFGFIELRPKGILILINKQLTNYCWPIAFDDLQYTGQVDLKIGANADFIIFENGILNSSSILKQIKNK